MTTTGTGGARVLVVNAGSSSLKYEVVDAATGERLVRGQVRDLGAEGGQLRHERAGRDVSTRSLGHVSSTEAIRLVVDLLTDEGSLEDLVGVGHRVVHGGSRFTRPVLLDPEVRALIEELVPLAPLHNRPSLDCVDEVGRLLPGVAQVAVFDTAFHATVPEHATAFAVPRGLAEPHGLRRYGFHGTSVEYVVGRAASLLGLAHEQLSLIVCHLGNGASVTAVRAGVSVDTSMGFSPLGGLVMGTRSGDIDASAVLHLLEHGEMSPAALSQQLNEASGLLGLTGDSDMRRVRARAERGAPEAARALAISGHRIRAYIGSAYAQLPDLDALVFTGGVGENDDQLRREVCEPLAHLGIALDARANLTAKGGELEVEIGTGPVRVLVVPTDEEHQIAAHTVALVPTTKDTEHVDHSAA